MNGRDIKIITCHSSSYTSLSPMAPVYVPVDLVVLLFLSATIAMGDPVTASSACSTSIVGHRSTESKDGMVALWKRQLSQSSVWSYTLVTKALPAQWQWQHTRWQSSTLTGFTHFWSCFVPANCLHHHTFNCLKTSCSLPQLTVQRPCSHLSFCATFVSTI
jgi:hypothetical protein